LQARGYRGAKKGRIKQFLCSRNAFGPLGAKSLGPAVAPACASGIRALGEIAPHVPLKAQQVKGLWEYAPAVLTKACHYGIGVEALDGEDRLLC
ncbi:MAG: hypothetical protein M3Z24_15300, partial [Chloroflexota bacterium]|nr:hypothetical protein [Chloroflexota bacterium]